MWSNLRALLALVFGVYVCHGLLDERILKDVYSIYTSGAIVTRDLTGESVKPESVTFYLFMKQNPKSFLFFEYNDDISKITDTDAKYVFIIHGWTENREKEWYEDLKNAFVNREDDKYNVFEVDWQGPANNVYGISSGNTKEVGRIVGDFVARLYRENDIPIENIHIVGHSLGAHVAGFAGKRFKVITGKKLFRITALDAAGPLFVTRETTDKLWVDDADHVVAIHTDGGTFGYKDAFGTIDFFPNGGEDQPGCMKINLIDITSIAEPVYCDHQRSWKYFIEAVSNPEWFAAEHCYIQTKGLFFKERKCFHDDVVHIGDLKTTKTGVYYLITNRDVPYGKVNDVSDLSKLFPQITGIDIPKPKINKIFDIIS